MKTIEERAADFLSSSRFPEEVDKTLTAYKAYIAGANDQDWLNEQEMVGFLLWADNSPVITGKNPKVKEYVRENHDKPKDIQIKELFTLYQAEKYGTPIYK